VPRRHSRGLSCGLRSLCVPPGEGLITPMPANRIRRVRPFCCDADVSPANVTKCQNRLAGRSTVILAERGADHRKVPDRRVQL